MKFLNKENGITKMYVQLKDISFLLHSNVKVPKSIYMAVLDDSVPVNEHKSTDFYTYTAEKDIEFLSGLDFIVDYKELRSLEPGELKMMMNDIDDEIRDNATAYDTLPADQKRDKSYYYRIEQLDYKRKSVKEIHDALVGKISLELPSVPDSDGFILDSDPVFLVAQGIDHDAILSYRKEGKEIEPEDQIPEALIQMGLSISIADQREDGLEIGAIETTKTLSKDGKYHITTYNVKKPQKEKKPVDNSLVAKLKKVLGI